MRSLACVMKFELSWVRGTEWGRSFDAIYSSRPFGAPASACFQCARLRDLHRDVGPIGSPNRRLRPLEALNVTPDADAKPPRRALLVVNRSSRHGAGSVAPAIAHLESAGVALIEANCRQARDLSPLILAHRDAVDCVIVAGGDGTVNAAGQGLLATGLPLGVLPRGTANDFARSIGVPEDLVAAARIIAQGLVHRVDVGDVNGHAFFNVASVGIAADLARSLTRDAKRRFGRLSYAFSAMKVLLRVSPFDATIGMSGEKVMVRTLQIAVGNGRYYGGGNVVAEDARIDDGNLDLYSLEFAQVWRLALMLPRFKSGAHGAIREVRTARGGAFEIVTRKPRPVNADGELVTRTPAVFTLRPAAVDVFVPLTCPLRTAVPRA